MRIEEYRIRTGSATPSPTRCAARERTLTRLEARLEAYPYRRYLDGPRRWECPGCELAVPVGAGPAVLPPMTLRVGKARIARPETVKPYESKGLKSLGNRLLIGSARR